MMDTRLQFAIPLLAAVLLAGSIQGQNCPRDGFFTFNGYCGTLVYEIEHSADHSYNINEQGVHVFDFHGKTSGQITIKITAIKIENRPECPNKSYRDFVRINELIVFPDCLSYTPEFRSPQIEANTLRLTKDGAGPAKIKYQLAAKADASGRLQVKYDLKAIRGQNQLPSICLHCLEIPYQVKGVKDPEQVVWENNFKGKGLKGWCDYVQQYPGTRYADEARKLISEKERTEWQQAQRANTIPGYIAYKNEFEVCNSKCTHCAEADAAINKIKEREKNDTKLKKDREAFEQARSSIEKYKKYLTDFQDGTFRQAANDSIVRLTEVSREGPSEPDAEGWRTIRLTGFTTVTYKTNVPIGDVDETALQKEGILKLRLSGSDVYFLEVWDKNYPWKKIILDDLDNVLTAHVLSWDSTTLKIHIEKGKRPYKIVLRDEEGNEVFVREGISDKETAIDATELTDKGMKNGPYSIEVTDETVLTPLVLGTDIFIKAPGNPWLPLYIAGGLVLIAVAGVTILLIRRQKRKPRTMFDID